MAGFKRRKVDSVITLPEELKKLALIPGDNIMQGSKELDVFAGVDNGSTIGRCTIATQDIIPSQSPLESFDISVRIPSEFSYDDSVKTLKDCRPIDPDGRQLYHNLDTLISVSKSQGVGKNFSKSLIQDLRICRGTKMAKSKFSQEARMETGENKTTSLAYHANVIDMIGYSVFVRYVENGLELPRKINVVVGVSVRPDERESIYVKPLQEALKQTYNWALVEYGIEMQIEVVDVIVSTEPEALVKEYTISTQDEEVQGYGEDIVINGGGTNSAAEFIKDGKTDSTKAIQLNDVSGTRLDVEIKEQVKLAINTKNNLLPLEEKIEYPMFNKEQMDRLKKDGMLIVAGDAVSYLNEVLSAKRKMATLFVKQLKQETSARSIDISAARTIFFSGNLFNETEINVDVNPEFADKGSLAHYIIDLLEESLPATSELEYKIIPYNLIPQGNLEFAIDEYPDTFNDMLDVYEENHPEEDEVAVDTVEVEVVNNNAIDIELLND